MSPRTKSGLLLPVCLAGVGLISCADDPFTPQGPYVEPTYRASVQSLDASFYIVCGTSSDDLYAVGDVILHHDGARWTPVSPPEEMQRGPRHALVLAGGELVLADQRNVFMRKDGAWSTVGAAPEYIREFWGSAPDDLYASSFDDVLHYDGAAWTAMGVPQAMEVNDISGNANGHVVMCGYRGRLDHFDGVQWTRMNLDSTTDYRSVAVTSSGRVFLADWQDIYEAVGSTPTVILDDVIQGARLRATGETLFAGGSATQSYNTFLISRFETGAWHDVTTSDQYLQDFWAADGEAFGVGWNNLIWRGDASGGARVPLFPSRRTMHDAVAIGDAIYTIGESAYRYENGAWSDLDKEYITRQPARGIGGRSHNNIYAVGEQMILHYDGAAWSWVNAALGTALYSVWVETNGDVVAVGSAEGGPVIVEFDGLTWSKRPVPLNTYAFNDVCGVGNMVVAVGTDGLIAMRRSGHWYLMNVTNATLLSVWGSDESHIYATSTNPNEICFFDGYRWDAMMIEGPGLERMTAVWGTSPSNVFALDYYGTLVHFDGRSWVAQERIFSEGMLGVCGTGREVLTVGRYGSALYTR